ncbi:MAG: hypothetical protein JSS81_25310 [Acidobacteria bacterium]|nr:hypothetical protein [Acidobacteriota bacterium]
MTKRIGLIGILGRLLGGVLYGAAFLWFTETFRSALLGWTGGADCCARCSNFLYDQDQPVLAAAAAVAFIWQSFIGGRILSFRYALKFAAAGWLSFQIYTVWKAWHLALHTPCTALYSMGPMPLMNLILVPIVLLIQASFWAAAAALPSALVSLGRGLVQTSRPREASLGLW